MKITGYVRRTVRSKKETTWTKDNAITTGGAVLYATMACGLAYPFVTSTKNKKENEDNK